MTIEIKAPSLPVHWKPMLVALGGIVIAAWDTLSYPNIQAALSDPNFPHKIAVALLIAALGFVTKQKNVTGGTIGQPSTYKAMNDSLPLDQPISHPPAAAPAPKSESLSIQP
jgi:hypothetical protein